LQSSSDKTLSVDREELGFQSLGVTLAGTVHLPASPPPHPGVVMLQGSGPSDRDGNGYFLPIRDAFLERGIAVYSFDKPGIGGSSGDWRQFALFDRADQAQAAIVALKAHAAIDSRRVGVWGQSQGGWIVQLVASRASDLAFAIANSGPGISPREQDLYGVEHTMRADGKPADHIERAVAFVNALHEAAVRGDDYATVFSVLLQPALKEPWFGYHTIDDAEDWGLMCRFTAERYAPAEALARIRCPFLAIFGELDPLLPAHKSAVICGQALREAGNPDATIVIFPQGNHRIVLRDSGEFVPGYLDLLADWAVRRVTKVDPPSGTPPRSSGT
jgi:dipeptidyl aminopeptidase/acylaminoacyl peptidase